MQGRSKILDVPYFTQPTGVTCQSTVLKMMASYLEQNVVLASTGSADRDILDIWKDINEDPHRPIKNAQNAHLNMKWWLEKHFSNLAFQYTPFTSEVLALESIVQSIDSDFPVLVSVSHARVAGHIILVIGYENYLPKLSSSDFHLVVHDPYGKFDPALLSNLYGGKRWVGGMSLMSGGEKGPGASVRLPVPGVGRQRSGDSQRGTYYLLRAARS